MWTTAFSQDSIRQSIECVESATAECVENATAVDGSTADAKAMRCWSASRKTRAPMADLATPGLPTAVYDACDAHGRERQQ